ncbi:MAG: hypothetical protein JJW01_01815 [Alphaproteobacteria bacterium]|nr:hypothetical protein [Rickettsiales bacterium]
MFKNNFVKSLLVVAIAGATSAQNNADAAFYTGLNWSTGTVIGGTDTQVSIDNTTGGTTAGGAAVPGIDSMKGLIYNGFGFKVGYETDGPSYFAVEVNSNIMGASNIGGESNIGTEGLNGWGNGNPLISVGLAVKSGYTFEKGKAKIYGIFFSDYLMSYKTAADYSAVYVGTGFGTKIPVYKQLLSFVMEVKVSFPAAYKNDVTNFTPGILTAESALGSMRMMMQVGLDYNF